MESNNNQYSDILVRDNNQFIDKPSSRSKMPNQLGQLVKCALIILPSYLQCESICPAVIAVTCQRTNYSRETLNEVRMKYREASCAHPV